jgi:DNA repair protein RadD
MSIRDYQQRSIDELYRWFSNNQSGHPCLVLPTGSGKSHIIAALCRDALNNWPETRVLMLTHIKELILQNAEKMRHYWPGAPMGIYSASIGQRQLGEPITFAGIQSVRNRAAEIGHVDLVVIDECHLVGHKDEGGYRKLIGDLTAINPALRVIGLTATPYRLGHGLITDAPALFSALIEPVSIEELLYKGYLAPLHSKVTEARFSVEGVHKRGGEYIESELQAAVDTDSINRSVVGEIIRRAGDRKAWLVFCAGVDHAKHIANALNAAGIVAESVTGKTTKKERERIIRLYKSGEIKALTNANVLTTGFDYPDIDLIAMLRPTLSPGLYIQMAGRGMRLKSHTDHCLVLDFAGNVSRHGPITAIHTPSRKSEEAGQAPVKTCESCGEICHASIRACPACGAEFPIKEPLSLSLRDDDIMCLGGRAFDVERWAWRVHTSRSSGIKMLACTYYGCLSDTPITEYLPVIHGGYAGQKAIRQLIHIATMAGARLYRSEITGSEDLHGVTQEMNSAKPPSGIEYKLDGKFYRVIKRHWRTENAEARAA